jgi:hypothetical protein
LSLDGIDDAEAAQFKLRWEIESWPSDRLWEVIRTICDEGKESLYADDFRFRDAEWMIDVIGRRGGPFPDWGLTVLEARIPHGDWRGNPDNWMQPLLATLAGDLRHHLAVAALIADLHVEDEVGNQASQAALVRIGTDDVVARILAQWHGASENFRSYAMDVLAGIRSDAAVMAQLKLFPRPDADPVIEYIAAIQLVESLSSEANEAVLRYLDERGFDDDVAILRRLSGSSALLGQELPDLGERLARAIERQAVEGREFEREMDRFRRRLMQLQAAPVIELDEEEQLPPVDSFVVGPIRVTKTAGRNDPCPCGSGRKFKKCCWGQSELVDAEASAPQ